MKNTIIIVLSLGLFFFLLHALGVFQFGSLIDNDNRSQYAQQRNKAVAQAEAFHIGVVGNKSDIPTQECFAGLELAAKVLNTFGGILNKPIQITYLDTVSNFSGHNAELQKLCEQKQIAICIGPFNSDFIPSMRSISQYYALPLISPLTVFSDQLPPLAPENFVTFFPPLTQWTEAIIDDMERKGYKNILLLSPGGHTYGDIFTTSLERMSRKQSHFRTIHRVNYQSPFQADNSIRILRNYIDKSKCDAIVFGGTYPEFVEFCKMAQALNLKQQLYGSDDLDVKELYQNPQMLPASLSIPQVQFATVNKHLAQAAENELTYKERLSAEILFSLRAVITRRGEYDAKNLIADLTEYQQSQNSQEQNQVKIIIREISK